MNHRYLWTGHSISPFHTLPPFFIFFPFPWLRNMHNSNNMPFSDFISRLICTFLYTYQSTYAIRKIKIKIGNVALSLIKQYKICFHNKYILIIKHARNLSYVLRNYLLYIVWHARIRAIRVHAWSVVNYNIYWAMNRCFSTWTNHVSTRALTTWGMIPSV